MNTHYHKAYKYDGGKKAGILFPVILLLCVFALTPIARAEETPESNWIDSPAVKNSKMSDQLISVNFEEVDIRVMLKTISDISGVNFIVDDKVQGKVTVISPTKIRLSEVYKMLESILEVKGYAAVPVGDVVKIVPKTEASKGNLKVRVGKSPSQIPDVDTIITQIIPLEYIEAEDIEEVIRPLLADNSHLSIYSRTNSILITGASSNIRHIAEIIDKLDILGSEKQIAVFKLEYASAQTISDKITKLMEDTNVSNRGSRTSSANRAGASVTVLPDSRTNSLVVKTDFENMSRIKELINKLDVKRPNRASNVHVVYLKNAQAEQVAESLNKALANLRISGAIEQGQNVQVSADKGTNALIITASAQDFEVISDIIQKLDIVREQVLVEMLIIEVSEDGLKEIGIDWATLDEAVSDSVRFFGGTNFGPRVDYANGDIEGLSIGSMKKIDSSTTIGTILHALEKKSGLNILSTPQILTSNHNKAKIVVGQNRPFVVKSRVTEADPDTPTVIKTFEYKDVGITLEITPHVSQSDLVRLEIDTKFTKLLQSATVDADTPTTAKRQAMTVVSMKSDSTVVIGGLIRDDKVTMNKKIPLLGDLPVLGSLFRFTSEETEKTNLLFFITPHVLRSTEEMDRVTRRKKSEIEQKLEEKLEPEK